MAVPTSYLTTTKNLGNILEALKTAAVPPRFTHEFLKQLGFSSSGDRAVINVMVALRFLDDNRVPTERYRSYRDPALSRGVLAQALRDAYADIFAIDEAAQKQSVAQLAGAFSRVSGKSDSVSAKMASTFKALAELADWSPGAGALTAEAETTNPEPDPGPDEPASSERRLTGLALRHDIHLHLPVTTDVKVYDAIFAALRERLT